MSTDFDGGSDFATIPEGISEEEAASRFAGLLSDGVLLPEDKEDDSETSQGEDSPEDETADDEDEDSKKDGDEPDDDEEKSDDDSEEPEGEEDSEQEAEAPPTYRIKIDGEEVEVTLEELQKGYSRNADYTRKTQALAEQRKAIEAEAAAYRDGRQQYGQLLEQMSAALTEVSAQEPDWEHIAQTNPQAMPILLARWQKHKERVAAVDAERAKLAAEQFEESQKQRASHLATEREKLIEAIPTWKDPATRRKEQAEIIAFARSIGYSDAEIANATDHRAVLMMRKAMEGARVAAKRPAAKAKIEKIKAATPGSAKTKVNSNLKTVQRARAKLAKTGSVDAAADLFLKAGMAE